jgi:plasmid stabilization system protein ParE
MRIRWSPQSLRDLDAIHEYIARDSERYADLTVAPPHSKEKFKT